MDYIAIWKDNELKETLSEFRIFVTQYTKLIKEGVLPTEIKYNPVSVARKQLKSQNILDTNENISIKRIELKQICEEYFTKLNRFKDDNKYFLKIYEKLHFTGTISDEQRIQESIEKSIPLFKSDIDKRFDMFQLKVQNKIGNIIKINAITNEEYEFIGNKDKCTVRIILAGGYNIQKLHTRMLIRNK